MTNVNSIFKVGSCGLPDDGLIPLYRQIINHMQDAINSGRLADGEKLPTEPELMKLFNVSRVTLRSAMRELEKDGYLIRRQGKGTFVSSKPYDLQYNKYFGFPDACKKIGKTSLPKFVFRGYTVPEDRISLFLTNTVGQSLPCLKVLRHIDDVPVLIESIYYLEDKSNMLQDTEPTIEDSIYLYISKYTDIKKIGGKFDFEACLPSREDMELLNLSSPDTPLLVTTDWNYLLPDNTPLFVAQQKTNTQLIRYYWERVVEF